MRRFPVLVALLVLLMPGARTAARAQEATPVATSPATLGLPELDITITDTGFDAPSEVPPAVLLNVTNATTASEDSADADLALLPEGKTREDLAAIFGPQMATPATDEATLPDWIYQATFAGGPIVHAGTECAGDRRPDAGSWVLFNGSPGSPQQPQPLTVTGSAASVTAFQERPHAGVDVDIQLQEYAFVGLEQPIPAGPHLWKFTNTGKQPHIMILFRDRLASPWTSDDAAAAT